MNISITTLQQMTARVHEANAKWWVSLETGERISRNFGEMMMLCISELAEAMEGHRKNLPDDKLPHRSMLEVELADALIRTLDILGGMNLPLIDAHTRLKFTDNVGENLLMISREFSQAHYYHSMGGKTLVGDSLCFAIASLYTLAEKLNLDIEGAYEEKMQYNAQREDHKIEARKLAGGKKY